MTWVFILGALYGIFFVMNVKWCQSFPDPAGAGGSATGILLTGLATLFALGRGGMQMAPHDWLLPFLGICFFFMPNYITAISYILQHKE